jgi:hypothetical protein
MKKGLLLVFVLLLLPMAMASMTVTLNSPSNGNTSSSSSMDFNCSVVDDSFSTSSIKLYTDTSGTWGQTGFTASGALNSSSFSVASLSDGTYLWNCLVENANGDTAFASSNYTFTVSSSSFSGPISNQSWNEDVNKSDAFDLDDYFAGASSYTFSGNSSITVSVDSDNEVSFSPTANWYGNETIIITSDLSDASNSILLTVNNVNDAPYIVSNISNQSTTTGTNISLTMSTYFAEYDSADSLNYTITSDSFSIIESGSTVTIYADSSTWTGSEDVTITASDGTASQVSNEFKITVNSSTSTTTSTSSISVSSYLPSSDPSINPGDSQEFSVTVSGDSITYTWYLDDVDQSVSDSDMRLTFADAGSFEVKVIISDGTDEETLTWTVTVADEAEAEVGSILSESGDSAMCGDGEIGDGETCSNCPMDVACEAGTSCQDGACVQNKSNASAIIVFLLIIGGIFATAIVIYYFTTLKKVNQGRPKQEQTFGNPMQRAPPADYTDFYKGRK